jgi:hypothetical protein
VREVFEKGPEELAQLLPAEMRAAALAKSEAQSETQSEASSSEPPPALPSRAEQGSRSTQDQAHK